MTRPPQGAFAVDGGGSNTVVRTQRSDGRTRTWRTPSCAIATVGEERAFGQLRQILARVCEELEGENVLRGCVASSSFPVAGEARPPDVLVSAIAGSGCTGRVTLVNDVVPLLWSEPLRGCGVVVNSGTGSVVLGSDGAGRLVKLGGHEHILSDQGSAYSIAREGLRAATRAVDGLGPDTDLLARAEGFYGWPIRELGRRLAELPRPRHEVARFAPEVVAMDTAGDKVAAEVVAREADGLAAAAVSAAQRLGLGDCPVIGFSGGVLRGSSRFRELVEAAMQRAGLLPKTSVLDSVASALAFAGRVDAAGGNLVETVGGLDIAVG